MLTSQVGIVLSNLIYLYSMLLFVYILLSWFPGVRFQEWYRALGMLFEPVLDPFRRIIPPIGGALDISPILLFILLMILQRAVLGL